MKAGVSDLPFALSERVEGYNLIVFDGECVLCSSFYRFVRHFDRAQTFHFATAQSWVGQALYAGLNLSTTDFETNLVVMEGRVYTHLDSFAAVMRALPQPWPVLSVVRFLPAVLKTPLYRLIARNRYRLFGRSDTCMVPDAAARGRFIRGGWS
jgi:predicted DCC family thiol-disulfide oxidoreductase YuxK